jgi:ABC-type sugar transport system ATPase subunit
MADIVAIETRAADAVRMAGVSRYFGGVRALENVDLAVPAGEIHALLGENGAGKSTILKILSGVQPPSSDTAPEGGGRRDHLRVAPDGRDF